MSKSNSNRPKAFIIPHASPEYSGHVAIEVLKKIPDYNYDAIVILGIDHKGGPSGIYTGGPYNPAKTRIKYLMDRGFNEVPGDHSIGWIVPLIEQFSDLTILPIVVSGYDGTLADKLKPVINKNTLIIASTDLSHHNPLEVAGEIDQNTILNIENRGDELDACGADAVRVLYDLIDEPLELVEYDTSAHLEGDKSQVVGYAAFQAGGFSKEILDARDAVVNFIQTGEMPKPSKSKRAAFVGITKDGELQGSMGQTEAVMPSNVAAVEAFKSTLSDERMQYDPSVIMTPGSGFEIKVRLFTEMKRTKLDDVIIGKDGLFVESGEKSAVFLPEVPTKEGWDLDQYMGELLKKAQITPEEGYLLYKFQTEALTILNQNENGQMNQMPMIQPQDMQLTQARLGGTTRKLKRKMKLPKAQDGWKDDRYIPPPNLFSTYEKNKEVKDYLRSYIMSPMYLERLGIEFPEYNNEQLLNERDARLNNLNTVAVSMADKPLGGAGYGGIQGTYRPHAEHQTEESLMLNKEAGFPPHSIQLEPNPYFTYQYNNLHEYSHSVDNERIPEKTQKLINEVTTEDDYYTEPTEFIARLQVIRYLLQQEGIYDPLTEKFTKEHWNEMKDNFNIIQDIHYKDVMEYLKKDNKSKNFIRLMNETADISDSIPTNPNLTMARDGGSLPKAQNGIEGDILQANIEADKWNKEYVQSANYLNMLTRAKEKPSVIESRIAEAMNFDPYKHITYDVDNPSLGMYYNTGHTSSDGSLYPISNFMFGEGMLNYNPTLFANHPAYNNPGIATGGWPALAGHELIGHYGVDKLNRKQRKALKSLINFDALDRFADGSKKAYDHGRDPYEMRANLAQLRYQLDKAGIYDSKKGLAVTEDGEEGDNPFTEEHLKQILDFDENGNFLRIKPEFNNEILQFVAPQDLIWMMNNIASTDEIGDDLGDGMMRAASGGELPKFQPGGITKQTIQNIKNALNPRYQILKNFRNANRLFDPTARWDIRGLNNFTGWQNNLLRDKKGISLLGPTTVQEINLGRGDLGNLSNYEIAALNSLNQSNPLDPRWNEIVQNYTAIGQNDKITSLLGEYAAANPYAEFDIFMPQTAQLNQLIKDSPNIFNVLSNERRTGELAKNLIDYGKMGILGWDIPVTGVDRTTWDWWKGQKSIDPQSFSESYLGRPGNLQAGEYKFKPGYFELMNKFPTANYSISASTMTPDPIWNLNRYRGRGEMDNQHNALLNWTNAPSLIISGDKGFANLYGGNQVRRKWAIDPERGKDHYIDHNTLVTPYLEQVFDVKKPFHGTFMKSPSRRTESFFFNKDLTPIGEEVHMPFGRPSMPTTTRMLWREPFSWLSPFKKRQFHFKGLDESDIRMPKRFFEEKYGQDWKNELLKKGLNPDSYKFNLYENKQGGGTVRSLTGAYTSPYLRRPISNKFRSMLTQPKYEGVIKSLFHGAPSYGTTVKDLIGIRSKNAKPVWYSGNQEYFNDFVDELVDWNKSINIYGDNNLRQVLTEAIGQSYGDDLFFKSNVLRNQGPGTTNIGDEYNILQQMHSVQPHRIVQPLDLATDGAGKILGYNMEYFPGVSLADYTAHGLDIPKYTMKNIDKTIKKLHSKGFVHGDLHDKNILINPTTGRDFRIIDPVGYPNINDPYSFSNYIKNYGLHGTDEGTLSALEKNYLNLRQYMTDKDYMGLNRSLFVPNKFTNPYRFPENQLSPLRGRKMKLQKYGGQTPGLALDTKPDKDFKHGGTVYSAKKYFDDGGDITENELEKLMNFIKGQEGDWDYIKSKDSAILKPDGESYYKIYEDGKFYPYYVNQEEDATIGWGRKGENVFDDYSTGIDLNKANEWLNEDINTALRRSKAYYVNKFGDDSWDKLSLNEQYMLADYAYNLGSLSKFPKFTKAIHDKDYETALKEYKRWEYIDKGTDKEQKLELGRNQPFLETYLQPWVDLQKQLLDIGKLENQEPIKIMQDNTNPGIHGGGGYFKKGGEVLPKFQPGGLVKSLIPKRITRINPNIINQSRDFTLRWYNHPDMVKYNTMRNMWHKHDINNMLQTENMASTIIPSNIYSAANYNPYAQENRLALIPDLGAKMSYNDFLSGSLPNQGSGSLINKYPFTHLKFMPNPSTLSPEFAQNYMGLLRDNPISYLQDALTTGGVALYDDISSGLMKNTKFGIDDMGYHKYYPIDSKAYLNRPLTKNIVNKIENILGGSSASGPSILTHEVAGHGFDRSGSVWPNKYLDLFDDAVISKPGGLRPKRFGYDYFVEPSEQYARMMQERMRLNLTPADEYTLDMFNQNKNMYGLGKYLKMDKDGNPIQFIRNMNRIKKVGGEKQKIY